VVAGEEDAGLAVVVGDVGRLMTGDRNQVDDSIAKIDRADLRRPVGDREGLLKRGYGGGDERDIRRAVEAVVAGGVIAVSVGVSDEQRNVCLAFFHQPLDDARRVASARACIDEQRALPSEDQVEEGLLIMRATRLAEDVEAQIVFVDLPIRDFETIRAARDPGGRKCAGFEDGLRGQRAGRAQDQNW